MILLATRGLSKEAQSLIPSCEFPATSLVQRGPSFAGSAYDDTLPVGSLRASQWSSCATCGLSPRASRRFQTGAVELASTSVPSSV
jgi:hypothetical protein